MSAREDAAEVRRTVEVFLVRRALVLLGWIQRAVDPSGQR